MTNSTLKKRVVSDIDYLKNKSEIIEKLLLNFQLSEDTSEHIQTILDYFVITDFAFIENISQENLLILKNNFSPYKISMEAFINYPNNDTLQKFIEANTKFYEIIESLKKLSVKEISPSVDHNNFSDDLKEIYDRINNLEKKPDILIEEAQNTFNEIEKLELITKGREEKSNQIYENIQKLANMSEKKAQKLISTLEKLRDKEISVELAIQLEEKCKTLKKDKDIPFRNMNLFIVVIFLTNFVLWIPSLQEKLNIQNIEFWQHFLIAFSLNIPWFAMFVFNVNEYSKSNKLYEEYEFRRISAITLFNNYSKLINELNMEKEDLYDSLKSSLDKIFDNPVHSIYGDKSGDKNIGLDQLEKLTSILEKLKPKTS